MPIKFPSKINIAHLPTPIEKLNRLSQQLEGPEIYLKRDDLTGVAMTGNKIRKLEFLLAAAQKGKSDVLITCGGAQSNHARATAVVAAKAGMKSHLVLRHSSEDDNDGNLLLDRLVGAEVQFINQQEYESVDEIMSNIASDYAAKGMKSYIIPEGGSNALGSLGYVLAMKEIAEQMKALQLQFDHFICAVGSGGTLAGMLLGKNYFDLKCQLHGINVCNDATFFKKRVMEIIQNAGREFGFDDNLSKNHINIIDGYVGKGYSISSQSEIDLIKKIACLEGVILDPVYTGKAMLGLVDQIHQGRFTKHEKILFWHTGGIFGLFPKRSLFF